MIGGEGCTRLKLPHKIVGVPVLPDGFPVFSKVFLCFKTERGVRPTEFPGCGIGGMRVY